MSAFTNGFNFGFVSGMFDRMFGGFAPVWGGNPFCNCNIWSGFSFNFTPMFYTPMMNTSIFTTYSAPMISMPVQNYTMSAIDTTAGWSSVNNAFNTGLDTFSFTNNTVVTENFGNNEAKSVSKVSISASSPAPSRLSTPVSAAKQTKKTIKARTYREMSDADMRAVYGNYTKKITQLYAGTAEDLNRYLKDKGVLAGKGKAFIDAQKQYGISASVLAAICINESKKGTSRLARNNNNVAGVRNGNKGWKKYASVDECIKDVARFLKAGYVSENLTSLYQVNAKYCPIQDPEDRGNNNGWAAAVNKFANEIERG